jgi:hypothetical protein
VITPEDLLTPKGPLRAKWWSFESSVLTELLQGFLDEAATKAPGNDKAQVCWALYKAYGDLVLEQTDSEVSYSVGGVSGSSASSSGLWLSLQRDYLACYRAAVGLPYLASENQSVSVQFEVDNANAD